MVKVMRHLKLTKTLAITECTDGWWIYDETRGMNLAMRAESEQAAFVDALSYYQTRLADVERSFAELQEKVDLFLEQFIDKDEAPE